MRKFGFACVVLRLSFACCAHLEMTSVLKLQVGTKAILVCNFRCFTVLSKELPEFVANQTQYCLCHFSCIQGEAMQASFSAAVSL